MKLDSSDSWRKKLVEMVLDGTNKHEEALLIEKRYSRNPLLSQQTICEFRGNSV